MKKIIENVVMLLILMLMVFASKAQNNGLSSRYRVAVMPLVYLGDGSEGREDEMRYQLQDIVVSYDLEKAKLARLPFQRAHIYCNMNNIGILWRANKYGIDPDAVPAYTDATKVLPQPRSITLGAKFDF